MIIKKMTVKIGKEMSQKKKTEETQTIDTHNLRQYG